MQDLAWPFLVSRNRVLGYQTVVAPGFLIDADASNLLSNKVEFDASDDSLEVPISMQLPETKAGPITLVYRVRLARHKGQDLRDNAGRPVLRFAGVVLHGLREATDLADDVLPRAEALVETSFRKFWNDTEWHAPSRSEAIIATDLPMPEGSGFIDNQQELKTETPRPPEAMVETPRRGVPYAWVFASCLMGAVMGGSLVHQVFDHPPVQRVTESEFKIPMPEGVSPEQLSDKPMRPARPSTGTTYIHPEL